MTFTINSKKTGKEKFLIEFTGLRRFEISYLIR